MLSAQKARAKPIADTFLKQPGETSSVNGEDAARESWVGDFGSEALR